MPDAGEPMICITWGAFGIAASAIFYSRFYVQWAYSEWKGRSEVPPLFWYQSAAGSIMLLIYAVVIQSPLGALSQSINLLPYSRNMIFIWRDAGRLNKPLYLVTHFLALVITACGVAAVVWLWWREFHLTQDETAEQARQTWFWLAVGVVGQALFGTRFLIQWIATEWNRKSIVPTVFWYISLVASVLQCAAFFQRGAEEWVYAVGIIATMLVYVRNLWLIHTRPSAPGSESPAV